jgi:membrane dipeptidase
MTQPWEQVDERAQRVHDSAIVIDCLAGSAMNHEPLMAGGLTAAHLTLAGSAVKKAKEALKNCVDHHDLIDLNQKDLMLVERSGDIVRAKESGKLSLILGFQGCTCLEEEFYLISVFHRLGIRIMQLTYSERNALGYGCLEKRDHGLTVFGHQVVRECNRLGIIVDLAHVGFQTAMDALEVSRSPAIISHANPRAVCENPRNAKDDLIKAVAETGGVVGISAYAAFNETTPNQWPTIDDMVTHIEYVANLVGIDHVGVGTDMFEARSRHSFETSVRRKYIETFRPYSSVETRHVQGLGSLRYFPRLTAALLRRGFSETDTKKIMGGNFLRVFEQVWG